MIVHHVPFVILSAHSEGCFGLAVQTAAFSRSEGDSRAVFIARALLTVGGFSESCCGSFPFLSSQAAMDDQRGPARVALHDEAPDADLEGVPIV
jgi:hypothetical protein